MSGTHPSSKNRCGARSLLLPCVEFVAFIDFSNGCPAICTCGASSLLSSPSHLLHCLYCCQTHLAAVSLIGCLDCMPRTLGSVGKEFVAFLAGVDKQGMKSSGGGDDLQVVFRPFLSVPKDVLRRVSKRAVFRGAAATHATPVHVKTLSFSSALVSLLPPHCSCTGRLFFTALLSSLPP